MQGAISRLAIPIVGLLILISAATPTLASGPDWSILEVPATDGAGTPIVSSSTEAEEFGWIPTFYGPGLRDGYVRALTVFEGNLIVAGEFVAAGELIVNNIARWDGESWSSLGAPGSVGVDGEVYALAVHDGDLIAGGRFTEAGGEPAHNIGVYPNLATYFRHDPV